MCSKTMYKGLHVPPHLSFNLSDTLSRYLLLVDHAPTSHTMMHRTLVFHNTLVLVSCSRLRILAAGGDGTVAWILKTVRELQLEPAPAVAVMPLGTGNDLSLSFGWGNTFLHKWIAVSLDFLLNSTCLCNSCCELQFTCGLQHQCMCQV